MAGFQSPNYTQAPNDLFDTLMRDMSEAELKVVMAVVRGTLGWHRDKFQLSIRKMQEITGLSSSSVQAGAKKAEERGLIERITDGQNSTYWRAVIGVSEIDTEVYQNSIQSVPKLDIQSGLNKDKESKRKIEEEGDSPPTEPAIYTPAQYYFKDTLELKRLTKTQRRDIADWEKLYPLENIKAAIDWANRNTMSAGRAIAAITTSLPTWGKKNGKPSGNGYHKPTNGKKPSELMQERINNGEPI